MSEAAFFIAVNTDLTTLVNTLKGISAMEVSKKMCLKIHGRVQGVFFRDSTRKKAKELGIAGFVENLDDGTVYLEAEGDEESLEALERWCHEGPVAADVTKVEKSFREPTGFQSFQVRYR